MSPSESSLSFSIQTGSHHRGLKTSPTTSHFELRCNDRSNTVRLRASRTSLLHPAFRPLRSRPLSAFLIRIKPPSSPRRAVRRYCGGTLTWRAGYAEAFTDIAPKRVHPFALCARYLRFGAVGAGRTTIKAGPLLPASVRLHGKDEAGHCQSGGKSTSNSRYCKI